MDGTTVQKVWMLIEAWHKTKDLPQLQSLNRALMNELVEVQESLLKPAPTPMSPRMQAASSLDTGGSKTPDAVRNSVDGLPGPAEKVDQ